MNRRIVVISDTHNQHKGLYIPSCDILIHCGDFTSIGRLSEVESFLEWFVEQPAEHKIFVAGNHELTLDTAHPRYDVMARGIINSYLQRYENLDYLSDISSYNIPKLSIYGTPFSKKFGGWAFGYDEKLAYSLFKYIPKNTDIVVSHGPPHLIGDWVPYRGGEHTGSPALANAIVDAGPKFHFFGHIHEARGIYTVNDITYVNAAVLDDNYRLVADPIVIDWDKENNTVDIVQQ